MQTRNRPVSLPDPFVLLGIGVFLFLIGMAAGAKNKDLYPQSTFLLFVEGFGLIVGICFGVAGLAILVDPVGVSRLLEDANKKNDVATPSYSTAPTTKPAASSSSDIDMGPWTQFVIFGGISLLGLLVVSNVMEPSGARGFLKCLCLLPAGYGFCSSYLFKKEAYSGSADWLMGAGMITVAVVAIGALLVFGMQEVNVVNTLLSIVLGGK